MSILYGLAFLAIALFIQAPHTYAQNVCTAANVAICNPYPCVQTDTIYSCLCPNMQLAQSAAQCAGVVVTTQPPIIFPTICGNIQCPAGATCLPTNQNPQQYICLCPNNIIANPDCPVNPLPNNPCLFNNPCQNGGTCVVNQLTLQPVCVCPANTYGQYCSAICRSTCDLSWCYNGGRCANSYGQAYCSCPYNYRGRRCELRYNQYNYVYLYQYPNYIGKK